MKRWMTVAMLMMGCNADAPTKTVEVEEAKPGLTMTVQEEVEVAAGAPGAVTVTVSRESAGAGAVIVEVLGLPDGATAIADTSPTFADDVTLNVSVAEGTKAGLYPVVVKASADDGAKVSASLALRVVPGLSRNVTSTVVDLYGMPIAGARVAIDSATCTTAADGACTLAGITPPYDVVVKADAFHVYRGLTSATPLLQLVTVGELPSSAFDVTVLGGQVPDATHARRVGFVGATAHVLEYDLDPAGQPLSYTGYGRVRAPKSEVALEPVATSWIAGEIDVPAGHTLVARSLWLNPGPWTGIELATRVSSDASFTWAVPELPYPTGVLVSAVAGARTSYAYVADLAPGEMVDIAVPEAPMLQSPIDHAHVGPNQLFWTTSEGFAVRTIVFASPSQTVVVHDMNDSRTYPTSAALGLYWPASEQVTWVASSVGPYASMDEFASKDGGVPFFGLGRDVQLGVSDLGTFTAE